MRSIPVFAATFGANLLCRLSCDIKLLDQPLQWLHSGIINRLQYPGSVVGAESFRAISSRWPSDSHGLAGPNMRWTVTSSRKYAEKPHEAVRPLIKEAKRV